MGSDFPLTTISVHTRRIDLSRLPALVNAFMKFGFPGFFLEPIKNKNPSSEMKSLESAFSEIGVNLNVISGRPRRRFSGDIFRVVQELPSDLPRNRYRSILCTSGHDGATLASELVNYTTKEMSGAYTVVDASLPGQCLNAGFPFPRDIICAFIRVTDKWFPDFLEFIDDKVSHDELERFKIEHRGGDAMFEIFAQTEHVEIEGSIDLRLPNTREWFFSRYREGVRGFPSFGEVCPAESFEKMLPYLLSQLPGGDAFTDFVGWDLRNNGVSALIFPSARVNPYVIVENGDILEWSGWNIVDYRDAPAPPRFDFSESSTFGAMGFSIKHTGDTGLKIDEFSFLESLWRNEHLPNIDIDIGAEENTGTFVTDGINGGDTHFGVRFGGKRRHQ